ncbi:MAG TPA: DUF5916 domain-containing protein [Gemmatimonadaceae bacterium]|nr:DUF5916 domain-containing protein [Gemmatimonadaceae bacterium]
MRSFLLLFAAALGVAGVPVRARAEARATLTDGGGNEVYVGRSGQTRVKPRRLEELGSAVDGTLDEAQWKSASLLTGFSQFSPVDGVPAEDSTEVLVWYSPTAIHFGIRAFEPHGAVRATLANRDNIASDDNIQLLLGTFNDGRQAMVFGVNPLGVQMDGILAESNAARSNDFNSKATSRDQADLSPDFVFESKGRLTEYGYEIEVRIPFKSLKYPNAQSQTWGLNVVRIVQHSGHEDSWTPAKRASLSFLGQSGVVEGMTDLRRGLVVDLTPEITQRTSGAPGEGGWDYSAGNPQVGGTVRWGVTNNMTLNATANPDFSQIESDAGQVQFDPRQSLYFTEKRPFFLDGSEQFTTPHNLVYTRRIVQPVAAAKLTGKMSGVNLALLSAVDRTAGSRDGRSHPVYNIMRLQHDLGGQSRIGATYTDRIEGSGFNRVADVDGRYIFGGIYSVQGQYARSFTRDSAPVAMVAAPLWNALFSRNGKNFGVRYSLDGVSDRFRTRSGFIGRGGIVTGAFDHRFTWTAPAGRWLETFSFNPVVRTTWRYQRFVDHKDAIEKLLHFNIAATARGGWNAGFGLLTETFGFDPQLYASYRILRAPGDTIAFRGVGRIPNQDWVVSLGTPEWQKLSANALYLWGHDENFFEWQSANIVYANYGLTLRPSQKLRVDGSYQLQSFRRRPEGTMVGEFRIPRLKVEYQLDRAIFLRLVGEYDSGSRDALIDAGRTGLPLLVDGAPVAAQTYSNFRGDFLFSYAPVPGTVFFLGYGAGYSDVRDTPRPFSFPRSLGLTGYARENDALFVKASYLIRL